MTDKPRKDADSLHKMNDKPPSEEAMSEILLEDELMAEEAIRRITLEELENNADGQVNPGDNSATPSTGPAGGDIDVDADLASTVGEEAVGGTAPTPGQTNIDEVAASVGVEMYDQQDQYANEMLNTRDDRRWELDPKSSEDYQDRRE